MLHKSGTRPLRDKPILADGVGASFMPSDRRLVRWALLGCLLYLATTLLVVFGLADGLDLAIDRVVYRVFGDDFESAWNLLSLPGGVQMSVAAAAFGAFVAWVAGSPRRAVVILVAALAGGLLVDGLKTLHERPYPHHDLPTFTLADGEVAFLGYRGVQVLPANVTDPYDRDQWQEPNITIRPADLSRFPTSPANAYPSGHTIGAAVSWGVALLLATMAVQRAWTPDRRAVAAVLLLAVVVGVDRVVVRSHWVTDVVAAWGLGVALVVAALLADRALKDRWPDRIAA
ncbi:MAG: hypothetical protein QOD77_590 [Thermoplasmata archaeon]|jgi:membrane-associated phospholipid phosphatase|nr:hypothetical protein [Thermoplasmata archaeon]